MTGPHGEAGRNQPHEVIALDPTSQPNDAAAEQARVREWRLRASGLLPGPGKPRHMPARDVGDIISPRQSYNQWHRGTGLRIRTAGGDEDAWLTHLAYALDWANAALGALSTGFRSDWASDEYRETVLALIVANAGGYVGLAADLVPRELDPDLRRDLLGPDVEDLVLGWAERSGEWVMGYAGLPQVDAEAFRYSLEPRSEQCHQPDREHRAGLRCLVEVRDMVDRRRGRYGMPLSVETVESRISRARSALRRWADEVRATRGGEF